jgi:NTE family protein
MQGDRDYTCRTDEDPFQEGFMRRLAISIVVFAAFFITDCGLYRINPPLSRDDLTARHGYRYRNLTETPESNTEKNFIIVTMSGGGTRAAALAYGVVEQMNRAKLDRARHCSMRST